MSFVCAIMQDENNKRKIQSKWHCNVSGGRNENINTASFCVEVVKPNEQQH